MVFFILFVVEQFFFLILGIFKLIVFFLKIIVVGYLMVMFINIVLLYSCFIVELLKCCFNLYICLYWLIDIVIKVSVDFILESDFIVWSSL